MSTLQASVDEFLAQKRIAVAGVSRRGGQESANLIYRKLRANEYEVFASNPKATEVEGDPCYATLSEIPAKLDGVVVVAPAAVSQQVVQECAKLGIKRVWLHRAFDNGSFSEEAVAYGREHNMQIIEGACPMMFLKPDFGHRCMRWILGAMGKMPGDN